MVTFIDTDRPTRMGCGVKRFGRVALLAGVALPVIFFTETKLTTDLVPRFVTADAIQESQPEPMSTPTPLDMALDSMRYRLPASDLDRYRTAFSAAERGDTSGVDTMGTQITDRRLIGHVLAQIYLGSDSHPTFATLRGWLDLYADLPESAAIYDLASAAKPTDGAVALPKPQGGAGRNDELDADPEETLGSAEPHTDAGEHAWARFFAADDHTALSEAERAIATLGSHASRSHWIAGLAAWRLGQYNLAGQQFAALNASEAAPGWLLAAGAYWAGRVEERADAPAAASKWFGVASHYRTTFYGMLAMRKLGLDIGQDTSLASLSASHLDMLAETPAGYRAIALLEIGRRDLAAQELERLDSEDNPRLEEALAVLIQAAHLDEISPSLAQRIAAPVDGPDARFPIPAWRPSGGFRVDPALVYAVARQESGFDPLAISPAGASGLMQIMPGTADTLAGVNRQKSLFDPSNNLDLGQRYLRRLMRDPNIGENLLLLAMAYNRGSGNKNRLRQIRQHDDPLLAIESIANTETRTFIQRVLTNYWMYRARLGGDTASLTDLANEQWPRYRWNKAAADATTAAFAN